MSIVSTTVHTNELTLSGDRRTVRFLMTDHLGAKHLTANRRVNADADLSAIMLSDAVKKERSLALHEEEYSISRVRSGENVLAVINSLRHGTKKGVARVLIRWAMKSEDVYSMLSIKPLVEDIKSTFSFDKMAAFLEITPNQLTRFITRYNKIASNETDLNEVKEGETFK